MSKQAPRVTEDKPRRSKPARGSFDLPGADSSLRIKPKNMKIGFVSLGCSKNLVDSEVMLGMLAQENYEITNGTDPCDIAVVNTCGFIDAARKESIGEILALAERKAAGEIKHLIVTGCLVQKHAAELTAEIPEIDALIGTGDFQNIHAVLSRLGRQAPIQEVNYPAFLYDHLTPRFSLTPSYSRYVKIAEGCNHTCSFCIIPQMRGRYRSRTVDSIVSEVRALSENGLKEANLISQETTYYGRDVDRSYHLPILLRALNRIPNLRWIRLFYNHPQHMAPEIIEAMADLEKVVHYVDMPLQHINDRILKSMRRGVTKEKTIALLARIREAIPDVVLRTTLIVGYPGETDEEFNELCEFVRDAAFDHVGVFTYSREKDVDSGHLSGQLPEHIKKDRYRRLMNIQQPISLRKNQELAGQVHDVLLEGYDPSSNCYVGRMYRHAPDVDGKVFITPADRGNEKRKFAAGSFVRARITDALPYDLIAHAIHDK